MKSTSKNISTFRQSLTKRGSSSGKGMLQSTTRGPSEPNIALGKSTTLRLLSAKPTKVNNYLMDPSVIERAMRSNRGYGRKKTTKTVYRNVYEQVLLKNSDKMRLIFWNQDPLLLSLKPLVVSADFIVNQDTFWQKPDDGKSCDPRNGKGVQSMLKEWRYLHKNNFVVWVVRNRNSWSRLQATVTAANLPVHAIFFVKRKKNYTVDYSAIVRELERQKETASSLMENRTSNTLFGRLYEEKLRIFETVKVNLKDVAVFESYRGKVPVLIGRPARVVLIRMDSEPPGLECITRCLQKWNKPQSAMEQTFGSSARLERQGKILTGRRKMPELSNCSAIASFISSYVVQRLTLERQQSKAQTQVEEDWFYDEEQIYESIDKMKRNLIDSLICSQGRQYQFEGGLSIYNFVGQMFKRNHKIMFENIVESRYAEERRLRKRDKPIERIEPVGQVQVDLKIEYLQLQ